MSQSNNWWRAIVLSSLVLCVVLAASANGQSGKQVLFGTVDLQRISSDYKAKQKAEADLQTLTNKYQAQLQRRNDMPFLSEDEQKQLDDLYDKGPEQNKAKITELETKAKTASDEMKALQAKAQGDLTADDKKKISDGVASFTAAQNRYAEMRDAVANQLRQKSTEQTDALLKQIKSTVAKVAQDKGVSIVFDSGVALYAGNDLTQPVLDALNKGQ